MPFTTSRSRTGVLKRVQVLRSERGCHSDIVAASCSLLLPLYAWCQQTLRSQDVGSIDFCFDSTRLHHTMASVSSNQQQRSLVYVKGSWSGNATWGIISYWVRLPACVY
ncbi:predicted protein [Lichtheimia corymbifera JMRC:FSU:9682]|uniref:Uncharacterized protein n=1 Tax=Lichtheimia corymbifera JMRC:FSU:9682 TaxID=1263082 RepID=A0A068RPC4_9FUNG|nr:predicted protein [Lichtheimia corymbifera JMRC:FSU:9682]